MTRCWAKLKIGLIREKDLTSVLYGPIRVVFANLSLALLCFSLMKGFFLALHDFSSASRSLFWTILAMHFTQAAVCHSFCRPLDVILWLSDIQMSWRLSRSVESHCRPLQVWSFVVPNVCSLTLFLWTAVFEILRIEVAWRSLYPSASKVELKPSFHHSKLLAWSIVIIWFQLNLRN